LQGQDFGRRAVCLGRGATDGGLQGGEGGACADCYGGGAGAGVGEGDAPADASGGAGDEDGFAGEVGGEGGDGGVGVVVHVLCYGEVTLGGLVGCGREGWRGVRVYRVLRGGWVCLSLLVVACLLF